MNFLKSFFIRSVKMPNWAFLSVCLFLGVGLPMFFDFSILAFAPKEIALSISNKHTDSPTCSIVAWAGDEQIVNKWQELFCESKDTSLTWHKVDSITFTKLMTYIKEEDAHLSIGDLAPLFRVPAIKMHRDRVDTIMNYVLIQLDHSYANGPEGATWYRSQIVKFRGDFLHHVGNLSYGPWFEKYDRKLLYHEKRFQKFLWQQTAKGNYPTNQ